MAIEERPLSGEEKDELKEAAAAVGLDDLDDLDELVRAVGEGEVPVDDELVFHLGCWWGREVRRHTGWSWVHLRLAEGLEAPALVDRERSVAVLPLQTVAAVLEGSVPGALLREVLERLARGERPEGAPGSYAIVG